MEPLNLLVAALAALSVLLVFMGLSPRSDVSVRLERYASTAPAEAEAKEQRRGLGQLISSSAAMVNVNRGLERRDWGANLSRELARADLALKPSEFLAIRLGAIVAVPVIMFALSPFVTLFANPVFWVVGAVVGFQAPRVWLRRRQSGRLKAFNRGLADTITLLANALRAGSSFLQSLEMVVRETQPPISTEFARVIREVNLGLTLEQALTNMTRRVRSDDLDLLTTAVIIQSQVGGNLAEILDTIAFTIRERVRIKGEIKTLTAQGRMSGYVVGFLPLGLAGLISVIAPTFMEPMFQKPPEMFGVPLGMILFAIGGFMMTIGFMAIRRIVDIEV
jgi:tight adherence protein B